MQVTVNGVNFNVVTEGPNEAPWVTLSHALATNLSVWDEQVALLKDRFRILRYDQRGHGDTQATPGPYTFDMLVADVIGLWDALGIERSHWIGLSIGGMIGYGVAIAQGQRLNTLTACDSRPDAPMDYAAYFQYRIDTARKKGMEGLVEPTIERWFTPETCQSNPPLLDKIRNMIRATDPVGHEGCCEALKTLAFGPRLKNIKVPTLILGGAADKGAPPEALAAASRMIPDCRHIVIENAGHISNIENPQDFNDALEAFLEWSQSTQSGRP
ncbi:MAG: alpha/beta fold hydrolase [Gammaproteobacteria bacterium]|nr:alpha/beta fold hydrolase [Gammaproteobacteria bacterium]